MYIRFTLLVFMRENVVREVVNVTFVISGVDVRESVVRVGRAAIVRIVDLMKGNKRTIVLATISPWNVIQIFVDVRHVGIRI